MADLFHDILDFLEKEHINSDVEISNFIKGLSYNNCSTIEGTVTIFKTLNQLKSKNLVIATVTNSDGQTIPVDENGQNHIRKNSRLIFNNLKAVAHITSDAIEYFDQKKRTKIGFWGKHPFLEKLIIACIHRSMVTPHSDLWYPLIPKHGNSTGWINIFY